MREGRGKHSISSGQSNVEGAAAEEQQQSSRAIKTSSGNQQAVAAAGAAAGSGSRIGSGKGSRGGSAAAAAAPVAAQATTAGQVCRLGGSVAQRSVQELPHPPTAHLRTTLPPTVAPYPAG